MKNLKLAESDDVVAICKEHVKNPDAKIVKNGKNYYVEFAGNLYTINGFNYCIITAKKGKYQKKAESKAFYMKVLG